MILFKAKLSFVAAMAISLTHSVATGQNYKIVDTNQSKCFDDKEVIEAPKVGERFYGQDAQFLGNVASYTDNGDGTITDNVTGLVWQKGYSVMSYEEALEAAEKFELAGKSDWRLPSIKEGYSLILFSGCDLSPQLMGQGDMPGTPFIDINFFDFKYAANGGRAIDTQMLTSSRYVGSTERENLVFGVNFADGRIKGYGLGFGGQAKQFVVRFVRGAEYGVNDFSDGGDGTISDRATSLMWSKEDCKRAMNWEEALDYAQQMNAQNYLGYSDWRVPNAKELQSIVDYSRSPLSTSSAAIDPLFEISTIKDESGADDYPFFWSSTTHENSGTSTGGAGIYVSFGRSLGNMSNMQQQGQQQGSGQGQRPQGQGSQGQRSQDQRPQGQAPQQARQGGENRQQRGVGTSAQNWVDIHGAGSQRSDPKSGDPTPYVNGHGPQGDAVRIYNYVRLVRDL
ncbi:MAG: DUF1566 domain-containing protein [Rikenellaceae bacterium]